MWGMTFRLRIDCDIKIFETEGHPLSGCHVFSSLSNAAAGAQECDISSLLEMLGKVKDRRKARGKVYGLLFILAVSVVAVLAGASNFRQTRFRE